MTVGPISRPLARAGSAEASESYNAGTVSINRGSTVLRGKDTRWHGLVQSGLPAATRGGRIVINGGEEVYDVHLVNSDGLITLKQPFGRDEVHDASYVYYPGAADLRAVTENEVASSARRVAQSGAATGKTAPVSVASRNDHTDHPIWEAVKTVVYALLIAFVIRAIFIQPFNIPSESMVPTLLKGDYIFVSKYPYGFSKHSLPFSPPLFMGRLFGHEPKRGDVVVFKLPSDNKTDYIKRLIGLPGDRIQVVDGTLFVNGTAVLRQRIEDFVEIGVYGGVRRVPRYRETLPNGVTYETLDSDANGVYDNTQEFVVPPNQFFMMGDNRDNSLDSRAAPDYQSPRTGGVGYVPFENLVGRAEFIFFSTDGSARFWEFWHWPTATRWNRLAESVQ